MRIGDFRESYQHDESILTTRVQWVWLGVLLAALLIFPFGVNGYVVSMACLLGIHIISTTGLNIMTGYTGLISLGHAAFMGVGCYTVAYMGQRGVPFFITLPMAGVVAALIGIFVGLPSMRIKGLYLAVATLATQFILVYIFREWDSVTGGMGGVNVPAPNLFGFELESDLRMYFLILPVTILLLVGARNLFRTRFGRAFIAIRDKDISAEVLGINLRDYKLASFAIGSFYAGVAGGLLAYFYRAMTPDYFTFTLSIFYLAAIIVGGLGSLLGSILGAAFMTLLPEILRTIASGMAAWAPGAIDLLSSVQEIVFGLLIIGFLVFEPHGLLEVWRRIRRFFHLWPFRA